MLILTSTQSLEVILNAAHTTTPLRCFATWRETTTTTFVPGSLAANTNGATLVTLVSAPAASTYRVIDFVGVINTDTAAKTVTIRIDQSATKFELVTVVLQVGERLEYQEGQGWRTYTSNGSMKQTTHQAATPTSSTISTVVITADVTNNNATANTIATVTGLQFAVTTGRSYWFRFVIDYTSAAATTGSRWSITGPTTSRLSFQSHYTLTTSTWTINTGLNAYDTPAASNATSLTTGNMAIIEGFLTATADGNVAARFASEVSSSAIVAKAGSFVEYIDVT